MTNIAELHTKIDFIDFPFQFFQLRLVECVNEVILGYSSGAGHIV